MNDRTDAVLASIDGALGDPVVSGDAMRWTPEPKPSAQVFGGLAALAPAASVLGETVRRVAEAMRASQPQIDRLLAAARDLPPLEQPPDPRPADPRQRALHARRTAGTGPPLLGPERSHAPRRIR